MILLRNGTHWSIPDVLKNNMKTKILEALKTEYKTLGLGEKAFDGVAAFLEKTITKEEDIVTAVKEAHVMNLLKGFQADSDGIRTARQKAEKDLADKQKELEDYKKAHPEGTPPPNPPVETEQDKAIKQMQEQIKQLTEQNVAKEKQAKDAALIAEVRNALKNDKRNRDALLDIVFKGVTVAEGDTLETLKTKLSGEYDTQYKALYGNGPVPPANGEEGGEGYKPGMFAGVVGKLQDRGYLPQDKE